MQARLTSKRLLLGAGLTATVVAVVLVLTVFNGDSSEQRPAAAASPEATNPDRLDELVGRFGEGNTAAIALPAVSNRNETVAWLQGDGTGAVQLLEASKPLWRDGANACADTAAALQAAGAPTDLLRSAAGVPDPVTQEILVDLHAAIRASLTACGTKTVDATLPALAWQWSLAERRLSDLGIA